MLLYPEVCFPGTQTICRCLEKKIRYLLILLPLFIYSISTKLLNSLLFSGLGKHLALALYKTFKEALHKVCWLLVASSHNNCLKRVFFKLCAATWKVNTSSQAEGKQSSLCMYMNMSTNGQLYKAI